MTLPLHLWFLASQVIVTSSDTTGTLIQSVTMIQSNWIKLRGQLWLQGKLWKSKLQVTKLRKSKLRTYGDSDKVQVTQLWIKSWKGVAKYDDIMKAQSQLREQFKQSKSQRQFNPYGSSSHTGTNDGTVGDARSQRLSQEWQLNTKGNCKESHSPTELGKNTNLGWALRSTHMRGKRNPILQSGNKARRL